MLPPHWDPLLVARSENGLHFLLWNRVRIWRTGRHTPTKNYLRVYSTHVLKNTSYIRSFTWNRHLQLLSADVQSFFTLYKILLAFISLFRISNLWNTYIHYFKMLFDLLYYSVQQTQAPLEPAL